MDATVRQYGRQDVSYDTWYGDWMKRLALTSTRAELEARIGKASAAGQKAARSHLRAIDATHSMQSNSQRRAQTGNVVAALGDERIAIGGALEIYDLFPEHTKEAMEVAPPVQAARPATGTDLARVRVRTGSVGGGSVRPE